MCEFVTRKKFAQDTGLSERALESWFYPKDKAPLKENIHYVKVQGRVLINKGEVESWIRAQAKQGSSSKTTMSGLESSEQLTAKGRNIEKMSEATRKLMWSKQTKSDGS